MKHDIRKELGIILEVIRSEPSGASIAKILDKISIKLSIRTLNRRIDALLNEGMVRKIGKRKATRYFAVSLQNHVKDHALNSEDAVSLILSTKGEEIRAYIRSPLTARNAVHYHREFLDSYVPNQSSYFSVYELRKLHEIGRQFNEKAAAGTFARQIFDRLLIDLSWNSSRLEGNTYSLLETERLIQQGLEAEGKSIIETQMILNHKEAIDFLVTQADNIQIDTVTIRNLHALLSDELLGDPAACGRLRSIPVGIRGTTFRPLEVPQLIEEIFEIILQKATLIKDPFEQAFFLMVHLPYLQPFEDVNKRVARVAANIPLIKNNVCPLSFVDVSHEYYIEGVLGVYELNCVDLLKDVFLWAYRRSTLRCSAIRHTIVSPDPFRIQYRQEVKQLIHTIIVNQMHKHKAIQFIPNWSRKYVQLKDRDRFVEVVETELMALHIGNVQRYRISIEQFKLWQSVWDT